MELEPNTPLLDDDFKFEGEETDKPDTKAPATEPVKPEEVKPDTETETVKPDTETETAKPDETTVAEIELLKKHNLERYGSLDKALGSVSHKEREIDRLQREARQNETTRMVVEELRKRDAADKTDKSPVTVDPAQFLEEFQTKPVETFEKMAAQLGFVRKADIEPLKAGIQNSEERQVYTETLTMFTSIPDLANIAQIVASKNEPPVGMNPIYDEIRVIASHTPSISAGLEMGYLGVRDVVPMLYDIAKERVALRTKPAITATTTPAGKDRAKTSGGGGGVKPGATLKRLDQMSKEEMESLSTKDLEEHLKASGAWKM